MGENKGYLVHPGEGGSVSISEDVIALIAANAAKETEGVAGISTSVGKEIADILGRKTLPKGVRITSLEGAVSADVCIVVKFGSPVGEVGECVQKNVASAVEAMTGFSVAAVNVHVCGILMGK